MKYKIRFISQNGEQAYSHVYPVAKIGGRWTAIDSVHDKFDQEPIYTKKKDYKGMKVNIISGTKNQEKPFNQEELRQRQQEVAEMPDMDFHIMTEKNALLEILKRKQLILSAMRPEEANKAKRAISIIENAFKGIKPEGIIEDENQALAARVTTILKRPDFAASGWGSRQETQKFLKETALAEPSAIGNSGFEKCLYGYWYEQTGGSGSLTDPHTYDKMPEKCMGDPSYLAQPHVYDNTKISFDQNGRNIYYYYGRSKRAYRVNWQDKATGTPNAYADSFFKFARENPSLARQAQGHWRAWFKNQAALDLWLEKLKVELGVLSKWVNELFRIKPNADATAGSGLLYTQISQSGGSVPVDVAVKAGFQRVFKAAITRFSSVSPTVVDGLIDLGVTRDSGGHDSQEVLNAFKSQYNGGVGTPVAAIIAAIAAVLSAIASIIEQLNGGAKDAKLIDTTAADTAQFQEQNQATIPSDLDWLQPSKGGGSGGNGSGSGSGGNGSGSGSGGNGSGSGSGGGALLVAGLLGLGLFTTRKKKST